MEAPAVIICGTMLGVDVRASFRWMLLLSGPGDEYLENVRVFSFSHLGEFMCSKCRIS